MYKKVPTTLNFVEREKETLKFWKDNRIFEKSVELRKGAPAYTFFDGPPTANGKPHIGHVLTRAMKDIIPRYKTMRGYDVLRKAGWDTHGLPVELEVEKELGLDGKEQIEQYGVIPFIQKCKESVWKYKGEWEVMSDRMGFWADMDNPYITYDNDYIESEWWALKTIYEKGLLYKGHKIVPYCPRCGTALSSHEVAQGYKEVKETSATVRFRVPDEENTYFLAWTTTPWTLPSNVSLCVNPDVTYAYVRVDARETLIMAKDLIETVLEGYETEIVKEVLGKELEYKHYEPLFECTRKAAGGKDAFYVMVDDYVTTTDGTGIVHNAPAFGEDDYRVCRRYDLPFVQMVDSKGEMCGGTPWDGVFVKKADPMVLKDLEERGLLFAAPKFEHSYPFCWRCDTPLIYYARSSWFIAMTKVKDRLIDYNRRINWIPETIKEGRMGNFLENVIDWGISRERYWGTPLPVWVCDKCGKIHVVGSRKELSELTGCDENVELHKPYVDPLTWKCECGGTMRREPVVIDCWFDSGSMPFAQWHYPFENKDMFQRRYPANFISEAIDQTRGWFYTLSAIAACLFDSPAFLNCIVLGHVQDKEGRKMSKHIGNVVDPWVLLDNQGADAVRWYFYTSSMPWLPNRFSAEAVSESQRKYMGTFWNTYAFYILYADIDNFDPTRHKLVRDNLTPMDRWILSRLNTLIGHVEAYLDDLKMTEAGREMQDFMDDLSNWYVRRCRERYWGKDMTPDKEAAYMTLYTVLKTMALISAPFTPFMSETMYQNMVRTVDKSAPESIHLCDWPKKDESFIDPELEANMAAVLDIVVLGRSARNAANIKNRQPVASMYVQGKALPDMYVSIIADELNVKEVRFVDDASSFISYRVKPQLKTLGPRYGKLLPKINQYLAGEGVGNAVVAAHNRGESYKFDIDGTEISLAAEDVLVSTEENAGFVTVTEHDLSVVLDTNLTPELIEEGFVREIVSKVQTMRKEAGFEVTDHIVLSHHGNSLIESIFAKHGAEIAADTLADSIKLGSAGYVKDWEINGESVTLGVAKS
ncbi:MAG: isoleucine--tRNA ligase [Eubacteriales bacterium]|nr:isoleucine--tRNA ligase [Clostridiales bacterium]MDY5709394.1 isoleucine--tRNA ligase [Eubacteriales bacterium]